MSTKQAEAGTFKEKLIQAIGGTDDSAFPVALACTVYVALGPVAVALVLLAIY